MIYLKFIASWIYSYFKVSAFAAVKGKKTLNLDM